MRKSVTGPAKIGDSKKRQIQTLCIVGYRLLGSANMDKGSWRHPREWRSTLLLWLARSGSSI